MKKLRVLVLVHEDHVPPDSIEGYTDKEVLVWKAEYDVVSTLKNMGHDVEPLGVRTDIGPIQEKIEDLRPHVVFNLMEDFHGVAVYDQHVISYLELMKQPYTGCNPRGLLLAHDKALSKKILSYHRIRVPRFAVFPIGKAVKVPAQLRYPLFVKSLVEEGSYGISQASIVHTEDRLKERVNYLHEQLETVAIAEEFVEGREFYVAVLGNWRLRVFPILELKFGNLADGAQPIATSKVKWDWQYQKERGIDVVRAEGLGDDVERKITRLAKRVYRVLNLSGYGRVDFRVTSEGEIYVLEANPNADIAYGEEMADSAELAGVSYEDLLQKIINLGLSYQAEWRLVEA